MLLSVTRISRTSTNPKPAEHPTVQISWSRKGISPVQRRKGRSEPRHELREMGCGSDWEKIVLARLEGRGVTCDVELRDRGEMLAKGVLR